MVAETSYTVGMARRHLPRIVGVTAAAGLALGLLAGPVLAADYEWSHSVAAFTTNGDWMPLGADATGVYYATADSHLAKYSPDGTPLWDHPLPITGGSAGIDDLAVDDSGVYLTGLVTGHWPGQPVPSGGLDAYLARYTSDGDLVWARQFTPPTSPASLVDTRLALAPGAVYMGLVWIHGEGMIAKVDRSGTVAWQRNRTFGGEIASMAADSDGAVVATIGSGLTAFSPAGIVRWSATDAAAASTWDLVAAPGGGTLALQLGYAGTYDAVRVRKFAANGAAGIGHLVASRPDATPTGIAVLGQHIFVAWSSGSRAYALDHANWASLDSNLNVIWSRSHAFFSGSDGFTALTVSTRGAFLGDGGSLAKVSIDNSPPVARWQDYVYPIYVPLPDGLLTGQATWKGNDDLSGIDFFQVQQSENKGSWTDVNVKDPGAMTTFINEKPGASYRFRVRAVDKSGNVGSWSTSPAYALSLIQDDSPMIGYDSAWKPNSEPDASGGTVMSATQAGATAQFTFKGDGFGFVTIVGPDRGKVAMYVDGSKVATLDLFAKSQTAQYVAFSRGWGKVGTHTVKLVVQGTAGRPQVDIDGFETRLSN